MNRTVLVIALSTVLCALPTQAQQSGPVRLGPATPPDLAGANREATPIAASAANSAPLPAPAPAPAPAAAPAPVPAAPAATTPPASTVAAAARVETPRPAAQPKQPTPRRSRPQPPPEPYADLPINGPARQALRVSETWAGNEGAIVAGGAEGRVVFNFGETMPTVVCAPLRMCEIELQPGERVMESPHIGDPVRWSVSPGFAGSGESRTTHVIIKPHGPGLDTNLLIPTDRRMYRIRLVSSESNYVTVVSFNYPRDDRAAWDAAIATQAVEEDRVVAELPAMSVEALDFNYGVTVKRGRPSWTPLRVFSDGERTFIQLPGDTPPQDMPAVVAQNSRGDDQLVAFRKRGDYVIVDKVIERAALISGPNGDMERVEIERGCARRTAFGRCRG